MVLYLLARIEDEPVALAASDVGSVIELGAVTPVPRAPAHVAGLCALRSRVLTVVDARAALGRGRVPGEELLAVVVDSGGHGYALVVDSVDDVVEAGEAVPCPAALAPHWRAVATGMVEWADRMVLLIDPRMLVEGRALAPAGEG